MSHDHHVIYIYRVFYRWTKRADRDLIKYCVIAREIVNGIVLFKGCIVAMATNGQTSADHLEQVDQLVTSAIESSRKNPEKVQII